MPLAPIFKWPISVKSIKAKATLESAFAAHGGGANTKAPASTAPNGTAFVQLFLPLPLAFHCLPAVDTDLLTVPGTYIFSQSPFRRR